MVFADNIYENSGIVLRNLNINGYNTSSDTWTPALTGYGFYDVSYEIPLVYNHYYYQRFTYKFTTTNQSPTWCTMYRQGGMSGGATIDNPVTGTEYTASAIVQPTIGAYGFPLTSGTIYNGEGNAINGVSSYVKNVLVYDITELYKVLLASNTVTSTDSMRTWCDNKLTHKPRYINYDVSSLIESITNVNMKKGFLACNEVIETEGMNRFSINSSLANNCFFDTGNPVSVYNNSGNGTVTHTRISAKSQNSPFSANHPYILQITTNGTASPYSGGFVTNHTAAANKIFIERFVAKIPEGYSITYHYNPQGSGASVSAITPLNGTGDWEEYAILYRCGSSGSFSSGGHIALNGSNNTSVTWYLAYVNDCDITGNETYMNYRVLPDKVSFKSGKVFTDKLNTVNVITNGDCSKREPIMLSSGWKFDTSDYAGNARCSLVQPVGANSGYFGGRFSISPTCRYKISYWVKCKADMTNFLTAIAYSTSASSGSLAHQDVNYKSGTKTKLTAPLNNGDTQMTVSSNSNWGARSYSRIGFRNDFYYSSYNDKGISNGYNNSTGLISGVSGSNIVTFNTAYTGSTMPSGTVVVESYDGATYTYPVGKGNLPTDNTWKYVEGYFGRNDVLWDGNDSNSPWYAIPAEVRYAYVILNLYSNTGTVPIKYSDIRVTPYQYSNGRMEEKVSIKCYD